MMELQDNNKINLFSFSFFKFFLAGIVSIIVFTSLYNFLLNPFSQNNQNMTVIHLSTFKLLRAIFLVPFIEEIIFRWGIQNLFKRLSNSNTVAILFTSLIFAYVHKDTLFLPYFFNSLVYGFMYMKTGKSLKMPVFLHMTNNLLSFLG
ncbi:CPBP family intramembrane glutamic endopeptidase [Alkalibacterium sp. 20]|uniref:CPBP family intramembrane glutamic endopeptidase n=1 Tax=Alkalibacterium sp. 20 TaxID=1798803 RepID=UPI0009002FCB|nr:hypothetical protein AX762_05410 [Alkalibacterium sp. 20]